MHVLFNIRDNEPFIVLIAVWILLSAQVPATAVAQDALELGRVYIQKNTDVDRHDNPYQLVVNVANVGNANSDVYVGCGYQCPLGGTASFFDVVNGGHLQAHSRFKWGASFRYMCADRPPAVAFQCTVRSAAGHERNYNFSLTLP